MPLLRLDALSDRSRWNVIFAFPGHPIRNSPSARDWIGTQRRLTGRTEEQ